MAYGGQRRGHETGAFSIEALMRRVFVRLSTAVLVSLAGVGAACAHAVLSQSVPDLGSAVPAPLREIRLTFTEGIEPAFSSVELRNSDGRSIPTGAAIIDERNDKQLVLSVSGLDAGRYKVRWHVVSTDGHRSEGQFGFQVRP